MNILLFILGVLALAGAVDLARKGARLRALRAATRRAALNAAELKAMEVQL